MTYRVAWGGGLGGVTVDTVAELDTILDTISVTPQGDPYNVSIVAQDVPSTSTIPPMVEICVGHPQRSYVYHVGAEGDSAWGYEPDLEPRAGFHVNYAGVVSEAWPERVRVTPTTARQAAREFVTHHAQRPDCLLWDTEDDE